MQAKIEQNSGMDLCEEYEDPIFFKPINEIEDPVLSPYTGHIYERADIVGCINRSGTDPMTRQPLTAAMLTSGRFVKQISEDAQSKIDKNMGKVEQRFQDLETSYSAKFDKLNATMQTIIDKNDALQTENGKLTKEVSQLRQENAQLKKGYVHPVYQKHGLDVENKLRNGPDPIRTKALGDYATKIKQALDEETLLVAANETALLEAAAISAPRGYGLYRMFGWPSETTTVATQLRDKINQELGSTL
jgi:regulator of replication initiation timing